MKTKLNNYILTDETKKEMRKKLEDTKDEEHGFTLCSKRDNIIMPRGHPIGHSSKIEIDPKACRNDEKFLGGYHTHPGKNSHASAYDLFHCGTNKITCIGGQIDNKIRCYTWKFEQLPSGELNKIADDIKKGRSLKYKQSIDCISKIWPIYSEEIDTKKMDKKLDDIKLFLSILKKSGVEENAVIRVQNILNAATEARNIRANRLIKEIKSESRKYYNEIEIK